MNIEDGCVNNEFQSFEVGKVYAIRLRDIKKFSYTNLNEPFGDFDLPQVVNEEEKYGKVHTPVLLDFGNFIEKFRIHRGIVPVKYMGNDCFRDIETGDMILRVYNDASESFSSLEQVEEDIASYHNHYLSIERNAIYSFDMNMEQKYSKFRNKFVDINELFDMLNRQAEQSLQINLLRLGTNEIMDAVYEGKTAGQSKRLIREMHQTKQKIVK